MELMSIHGYLIDTNIAMVVSWKFCKREQKGSIGLGNVEES